jgi:hypothetical protein
METEVRLLRPDTLRLRGQRLQAKLTGWHTQFDDGDTYDSGTEASMRQFLISLSPFSFCACTLQPWMFGDQVSSSEETLHETPLLFRGKADLGNPQQTWPSKSRGTVPHRKEHSTK